jgi:predicted Ser/Thr protein kinase
MTSGPQNEAPSPDEASGPSQSAGDDPSFADGELRPGYVLAGRYRIEGRIGTGGIGIVYRAAQLPLERPVAVKVLHDDLLSMHELRARFEREARVLSALSHPHVVSISDYGIDEDRPFLVMELLEGETLEEVVRRGPMAPELALELSRQILRGLASAHQKGIAHRDLKPANVLLMVMPDGSEHVKLLDFGLARMVQSDGVDDEPVLTKRGVVFGTPAYMSPEQASGTAADERSDVYSAGVLLFELLAGRRPFLGDTRADLLRAHLVSPVPRLAPVRTELRIAPALSELLDVAMAKDPRERYPHAAAMLGALDAIPPPIAWLDESGLSDAPTEAAGKLVAPARPSSGVAPWLGLLAVVAVGLVGFWLWPSSSEVDPDPDGRSMAGELDEAMPDPPASRPEPRDPWADPPPEPLRPFLRMAEEGHVFQDRAEIRPLFALARAMDRDPRPRLLMGHLFFAKGWLTEGIRRYQIAARLDPSVRGDRRMLSNLVSAASRESVGDRAASALESIYGAECLPAVQVAIGELDGQPLPQLRLTTLRDRIVQAAAAAPE